MQKWDYKIVLRSRGYKESAKSAAPLTGKDWQTQMEDDSWQALDDFEKYLIELGERGWELVSVVAESGLLGGGKTEGSFADFAGFTNTEKWVFKRPKP